ncbi:pyruvate kinase [Thiothrix fructosivorans]|uniref:Pyruvate kinase n=1 Tax=Thiothrix fructosivorans TaxID=111770 RepID=A0A8B0SL04_9GAMM|nr:pyruvate kinase [Thiothrix fructosivorans]MBO0612766.1 pyruvate kinase [Thiothrix fructosivorans]QTX11771.1 pyruvate kinase [Thiothrix fructosivorans]
MRRTKIVATMGPATDTPEAIEAIIRAGVDVVRMNFSHGTHAEHAARAQLVRELAAKVGRVVAILGDLQGPKLRIARFKDGKITLKVGDSFILDAELASDVGDQERVGLGYKELVNDVSAGDELWLDDGRIVLEIVAVKGQEIHTRAINGGILSNNKGLNRRGGGLSAEALTDKDKEDIAAAASIGVDFLAVSFPRCADDIHEARRLALEAGCKAAIVAKMERAETMEAAVRDEIILASDVIMIARGDLGVEIGDAKLPQAQKCLISRARTLNRAVITATQMMETMTENPIPTRAEVFDVANAVMDGTDAVMLSGETATGKHPALVVKTMAAICKEAENSNETRQSGHRMNERFGRIDEGIAMATMYTANHMGVRAIAALTESGATPLWMSRIRSGIPIYALTSNDEAARRVCMYRGVYPVKLHEPMKDPKIANRQAVELMIEEGIVENGDLVIITKGDLMGAKGGTNQMKILRVGEHQNG